MKVVNVIGGLGNQMFQYAFALSLKKFCDDDVFLDIHHFKGYKLHNGFEIKNLFPEANLEIIEAEKLKDITYVVPNYTLSRIVRKLLKNKQTEYIEKRNYSFDKNVYLIQGDCYYEGYWQAMQYYLPIKEEIVHHFKPKKFSDYSLSILKLIDRTNSVGIHVRRGDYLKEKDFQGICDLSYYKNSIQYLKERNLIDKFYIFSNDLVWCKDNIIPLIDGYDFELVTGNSGECSYMDMFLMSHCKYLIIANSSFSWWGAFLNQRIENKVLAPSVWTNSRDASAIYDSKWIKK